MGHNAVMQSRERFDVSKITGPKFINSCRLKES